MGCIVDVKYGYCKQAAVFINVVGAMIWIVHLGIQMTNSENDGRCLDLQASPQAVLAY